jgi:glutathione peroxidase
MRKLLIVLAVIALVLIIIKRKDMTWRQSIMKAVYPLIMLKSKLFADRSAVQTNAQGVKPVTSFYDLTAVANDGTVIDFHQFMGNYTGHFS